MLPTPAWLLPVPVRRHLVLAITAALVLTLLASGFAWADLKPAVGPAAAGATSAPIVDPTSSATVAAPVEEPATQPAGPPPAEPVAAASSLLGTAAPRTLVESLVSTATGLTCSLVEGAQRCTHDDEHQAHTAESAGSTATAPQQPIGCAGDGRSGNRIQVVYVRQSDKPDRFASVAANLRAQVNVANGVFHRSSNGRRHLRVVTDARCNLAIERVTLSPTQAGSIRATATALRNTGRTRSDRKYLLFVDNGAGCGVAEMFVDDRATAANRNNLGNMYAAVYNRCWTGVVVAHELTHVLGGVQPSAPRSTGRYGHCTDQHDVMCYRDGSGKAMTTRCSISHQTLLDCGRDDYFSIAPAAGSYLARYWNAASNSFLVGGGPAKPPPPAAPSAPVSVASARSGDNVRITWGAPTAPGSGVAAFDVVDLAAGNQVLATVGGTARAATIALTPWRTYRLAVLARNSVGRSAPAGGHQHMVGRAPAAPTSVSATHGLLGLGGPARISWTAPAHAESYLVLRDGRQVAVSTTSSWTDQEARVGTRHTYSVVARNGWGTSPRSADARASLL